MTPILTIEQFVWLTVIALAFFAIAAFVARLRDGRGFILVPPIAVALWALILWVVA